MISKALEASIFEDFSPITRIHMPLPISRENTHFTGGAGFH